MCLCHCLYHIRNQFTGRQRIVHSSMTHGYTIAYPRNAKEEGIAPTGMHPLFNEPLKIAHANVSRDEICKTCCNANKGFSHLTLRYACCKKERPMRYSLKTIFYCPTSHYHNDPL